LVTRSRIAAPPAEERRATPAPAHLAHLPSVADVAPGDTFWCSRIAGAVSTHLCGARRVAMTRASAGTRPMPVYRDCFGCPDGAALADRLTHAPPAPERRRLPVIQPPRLETTTMTTTNCDAKDCDKPRGGVRSDTNPALAPFCNRHRGEIRDRSHHDKARFAEVAQALREGAITKSERHVRAAQAANAARAATATPPKPAPVAVERRPTVAPTDGLALVRRMAAAITRLGGIDAAEALADELATMGGAQ
jgi:hypothetical protein